MILHLLTDEKFTDYAIKQFSAPEMMSEFVLVPTNNMMGHVRLIDKCRIVNQNSPEFNELLTNLGNYAGIIFHGLMFPKWQTTILKNIPNHVKVALYFWGGEIYSRQDIENSFYAPITKCLVRLHNKHKSTIKNNQDEIPYELFNKVDYFLTSIKTEYEFAKQYTTVPFQFIWYTCYSLEETIGPLLSEKCSGNNIWIGNSAAPLNNHFDLLWLLWKRRFVHRKNNAKFIIPLSYGAPWVKNWVLKFGNMLFRHRMQPLVDFMPRNEYNKMMLSCSTMVIGYWEPAANGNIITALWLGMRVYLSEKNIALEGYTQMGLKVFSIESDLKNYQFTPLSDKECQDNRDVLTKWFGKHHVMKSAKEVINALQ